MGQILVTGATGNVGREVVRELAAGKSFAFADRGHAPLTGLDEPVRLWELLWAHAAT